MLLPAKFVTAVRSYIEDGVPLEDMKLDVRQIERVRVAEKVYDRLRQDPMMDVQRCLRRTFGRKISQVSRDMEVIGLFMSTLEGVDRDLAVFRARKVAENIVRIGQQTGDWKPMRAGLDKLIQIDSLDKPAESAENIGDRTYNLPPVFVRVETVDSKYQTVTEEQRLAIIRKYGGVEDLNMAMVKQKALTLAEAVPAEEVTEAEEKKKEATSWDE